MPVINTPPRVSLALFLLTLALCILSTTLPADSNTDSHSDAKLEHAMEELQTHYRALTKNMRQDNTEQQSADLIQQMIIFTVDAKAEAAHVHIIEDASPADQTKLTNEYRIKMNDALIGLAQAENALLMGNKKQAAQYLADVKAAQRAGHRQFKDD